MKGILAIIFGVLLIISIVFTVIGAVQSAQIDSWLERAKDAGNPAQVAEFLTNYKQALYDGDRVEGKYSTLFHYPGSYMPVYLRAVDGLIERASALAKQTSVDESYQMGLINLEKDLGDLEAVAFKVWGVHHGGFIWEVLIGLWSLGLLIVVAWAISE